MRVDHKTRQVFICDSCGANTIDNKDLEISFLSFKIGDQFSEEPSFGDGADSESEIYKFTNTLEDSYDLRDEIREVAYTDKVEICHDCYLDYSSNNYVVEFNNALRQRRGEILLKYIKAGELISGFTNEEKDFQKHLKELKDKETFLRDKLKKHIVEGRPTEWIIDSLLKLKIKIKEIQQRNT